MHAREHGLRWLQRHRGLDSFLWCIFRCYTSSIYLCSRLPRVYAAPFPITAALAPAAGGFSFLSISLSFAFSRTRTQKQRHWQRHAWGGVAVGVGYLLPGWSRDRDLDRERAWRRDRPWLTLWSAASTGHSGQKASHASATEGGNYRCEQGAVSLRRNSGRIPRCHYKNPESAQKD